MKENSIDQETIMYQNQYVDYLGNSLHAVISSLTDAHHLNKLQNAQFEQELAKAQNLVIKMQAGDISAEQMMTGMLDLPLLDYVDDEDFGLDTATYRTKMDVDIHNKVGSHTEAGTDVKTSASYGGGLLGRLMGVHASVEATAHFKTSNDTLDETNYDASSELEVTMKRFPAPPGRKLVREFVRFMFKLALKAAKARAKQQQALQHQELADKPVPKNLAEFEKENPTPNNDTSETPNEAPDETENPNSDFP